MTGDREPSPWRRCAWCGHRASEGCACRQHADLDELAAKVYDEAVEATTEAQLEQLGDQELEHE